VIRLLLDQGLPRSTGAHLSALGWDVIHVGDVGMSQATDDEVLAYARQENRICVTLDADFHALLAISDADGPSVIRVRQQGLDGAALADLLRAIWARIGQAIETGAMVTVTESAIRVHRLPISGRDKM
jgi:predicted nuclease of predicted toxin-antitoxin system